MAAYVGLNVGGKIYQTSLHTLTSDPNCLFRSMLTGKLTCPHDEKGNLRIDRDGDIFRYVLNYLRYGRLFLPDGFTEYELLECEADFFQLSSLKAEVQILMGRSAASEKICLNVGGKIYQTTRTDLSREPESVFRTILDEDSASARGQHFIHADGNIFRHILNFLRHGYVILPDRFEETELLKAEARTLKLRSLLAHVLFVQTIDDSSFGGGLVLFHRRTGKQSFVVYLHQDGWKARLSVFLDLVKQDCTISRWGQVRSIAFKLDESRFGEELQIEGLRHRGRMSYPTSKASVVNILSVCGYSTQFVVEVDKHTSVSVFGWQDNPVSRDLIQDVLAWLNRT